MSEARRKLTAVLVADVQGYTRLMEIDEENTRRLLNVHRERFAELSSRYGGRVIDTSGDSVLAEFESVQHAVECAVEFQLAVSAFNGETPYSERMEYRIGVNVGDVLDDGISIYGDAVNTTARIQSLAPPGGVCVSGAVREIIEGRVRFGFQFLREQRVKNRSRSVRVFRVMMEPRTDLRRFPGSIPIKLTLGDEPGIAVLPFNNLEPDPEKQYLGDGIAEDIITELSRFRSIHVMARTTSFSYRDEEDRLSKLRDELNVQYALEGSIRSVGRRIRITAQLVECETGKHIWGDRYTHDADAISEVQDEVVSLIVSMLENRLLKDRMQTSARRSGQTRRAYDLWLRGNQLLERLNVEAADQAEQLFLQATRLDSGFARAHAGLAAVLYLRASLMPGKAGWYTELQRALDHSRTAVRLDPADGRSHA
ncbi:MAG: adenylate/guanylate cyclase domain-containing protein, partial [Proteobacteria bacterium]